jgi:hypothetical protein
MVVNVYDSLHITYAGSLISDSVKVTAIEHKDHIIIIKCGKFMDYCITAGKKTIIPRCFILIINYSFLA